MELRYLGFIPAIIAIIFIIKEIITDRWFCLYFLLWGYVFLIITGLWWALGLSFK